MTDTPEPAPRPQWNPDRVELLKTLWADGLSGSAIEARLGFLFTRNAVIGKVHRLKLVRRTNSSPRANKPKRPAPIRPRAPSKPSTRPNPVAKPVQARPMPVLLPVVAPVSVGVYIQDVTGCRHGIDFRDGKHLFCDAKVWQNPRTGEPSSYCDWHHQLNHRSDGR